MDPMYPKPDRSGFKPRFEKTPENDETLDIGWWEGQLSDGRSYRAEMWAQDQVTHLTFLLSTEGLESLNRTTAEDLLRREELVGFRGEKRFVYPVKVRDSAGQSMWSINVVIGVDSEEFAFETFPLNPYKRPA